MSSILFSKYYHVKNVFTVFAERDREREREREILYLPRLLLMPVADFGAGSIAIVESMLLRKYFMVFTNSFEVFLY
jgi:hypothetical protein